MLNMRRENRKIMIALIFIMMAWAIKLFPFKFGGWNQMMLGFSYRYGFIQRGFIGSVLDLISMIFHIPLRYMRYIYGVSTMGAFTLLLLLCVYRSIAAERIDPIIRKFLIYMAILFFVGPGWVTNYNNFALTDVWLLMISVPGMYAVMKEKNLWVAVLAPVVAVLIHPEYVFLYFSLILGPFFYKTWVEKQFRKRFLNWMCMSFLCGSAIFCYMMFFAQAKAGVTLEDVMDRVAIVVNRSVADISHFESVVNGVLFRKGDVTNGLKVDTNGYQVLFVVMLVMYSPFIFEIYKYWKTATENAGGVLYALLPLLGVITAVPIYVLKNDYGRWTYAVFFYEFALIWILNLFEDKNIKTATKKFMEGLSIHKVYYIFLTFYAIISSPIEQNLLNPIIANVEQMCWKVFIR